MSATIIKIGKGRKKRQRRASILPPRPLFAAADQAARLLRRAEEHLADVKGVDHKNAVAIIGCALGELERGMAAHVERAKIELGEAICAALGEGSVGQQGLTVAEIAGARNVLKLILGALPDYSKLLLH